MANNLPKSVARSFKRRLGSFASRSLLTITAFAASSAALAQQGDGTNVPITTTIFKPDKVEPTAARIAALARPDGFRVAPFATGLQNVRIIVVSPEGWVYASRRDEGDVILLKDENGDGQADGPPVIVANIPSAHGLAIKDGKLYIATVRELYVADIETDGKLSAPKKIVDDLPDAGQHANRSIAFGPDNMLYESVGSTCNDCNESNPENATILRIAPDGKSRNIFATGLRNTIGFAWQPQTGELWGMDNGIDFLGDAVQPEELNRLKHGKAYGWPHVWGNGQLYSQSTPVGHLTKDQWRAMSEPMVLGYTAHAAPMQMVFYPGGMFPSEYAGDAFVTMRGSWNASPATGYEIVRVHFKDGQPEKFMPFVSGFLTDGGKTHFARPMGLAVAKDGALLMGDDANGVIYRISYDGPHGTVKVGPPPATEMKNEVEAGAGVPLALARPETNATGKIEVTSAGFTRGGAIPVRNSSYGDNLSPELSWKPVAGAKSYAIIVEDPDAKPIAPVVHWVAWNIPSNISTLAEGLQAQARLTDPDGVLQGRNSRGSQGFYGPHPPIGDPEHHYHIQILALDEMIDILPGSDRDTLLNAAKGHVIATGEIVGLFSEPTEPKK